MHDPPLVHVVQRAAHPQRNLDRTLDRELLLFVQQGAQQSPVHPLHNHVHPAALFAIKGLHHTGVIQQLADLLFAFETLKQHRVCFHLRVRNLDGDLAIMSKVSCPVEH